MGRCSSKPCCDISDVTTLSENRLISVQPIVDEKLAPTPPTLRRDDIISDISMFKKVDSYAAKVSQLWQLHCKNKSLFPCTSRYNYFRIFFTGPQIHRAFPTEPVQVFVQSLQVQLGSCPGLLLLDLSPRGVSINLCTKQIANSKCYISPINLILRTRCIHL